MAHFKRVRVISGEHKGKQAKVISVDYDLDWTGPTYLVEFADWTRARLPWTDVEDVIPEKRPKR